MHHFFIASQLVPEGGLTWQIIGVAILAGAALMLGFFILEGGGEGVEYSRRGLVFLSAFCFGSLAGGYAYALGALVLLILVVGVAAPMVFAILILMLGIMST